MKKLNREQQKQHTELAARLSDAKDAVEEAVNKYNEIIAEMNTFQEEVVSAIDDYVNERSEKWQEGDRATAYEEWKGEWETELDELDMPDMDQGSEFEQRPTEPSS